MANSLGTLSPDVVSMTVLDFLAKKFPPIDAFTTDFSKEQVKYGKKVTTRVVTVPTAADYDEANGYEAGDAVTTDIDITMNKWKHVTLEFTDAEIAGTNRKLAEEQMAAAAYALGKAMMTDLFALANPTYFTETPVTVSLANTARSTINSARSSLSGRGAGFPRNGVLNTSAFGYLTNDDKVISNLYVPDQSAALPTDYEGGVINNLCGFQKIFEFPDLPSTGNTSGFFGAKSALCIVARVPSDPSAILAQINVPIPGIINTVSIPQGQPGAGLTIMHRFNYDMQKGKLFMTLVLLYGVGVGIQGQGQMLVTA
jgi:hypothetical protein